MHLITSSTPINVFAAAVTAATVLLETRSYLALEGSVMFLVL